MSTSVLATAGSTSGITRIFGIRLLLHGQAWDDRCAQDTFFDRLSLLELRGLAAGKPVKCRLVHSDGSEEVLELQHSYSERQLTWLRAGSALNTLRQTSSAPGR